MNYYEHHIGDFIKDTVGLTMAQEGCYRRLLDQYYAAEKPLPLDLKECRKLARPTTIVERKAFSYIIEKFFERTSDGYRQKRCDEVISAYLEGEPERVEKRENDKDRKRRSRERRKSLFEQLRLIGITPSFDSTIARLEELLSKAKKPNGHANGHGDGHVTGHKNVTPVTAKETACDSTATQSHFPLPTSQSQLSSNPLPPFEKGVVSRRRSPRRAEKDEARARWTALISSGGADRDPRVQAAMDKIGGWPRIQQRTDRDESRILSEFCDAYLEAATA